MKNVRGLLLILLTLLSVNPLAAQSQEKIYALFIINFARGISWPSSDHDGFTVDVVGYPPLVAELNQLTSTTKIHGKKLHVRQIDDPSEAKGQIIFLPAYKSKILPAMLKQTESAPRILVSNSPGFARNGGAINFLLLNGKLTYEINVRSIEKRGMKVSTNLKNSGLVVSD